jgi:hypothetical protein
MRAPLLIVLIAILSLNAQQRNLKAPPVFDPSDTEAPQTPAERQPMAQTLDRLTAVFTATPTDLWGKASGSMSPGLLTTSMPPQSLVGYQ